MELIVLYVHPKYSNHAPLIVLWLFLANKITQSLETFHPSFIRFQQVKVEYLSSFLKTMISDDFDRRRISQPKTQ